MSPVNSAITRTVTAKTSSTTTAGPGSEAKLNSGFAGEAGRSDAEVSVRKSVMSVPPRLGETQAVLSQESGVQGRACGQCDKKPIDTQQFVSSYFVSFESLPSSSTT